MADKNFSSYTPITSLNDADDILILQSGTVYKTNMEDVRDYLTDEIDGFAAQTTVEDANKFYLRDGTDDKNVTGSVLRTYVNNSDYPSYKNLVVENNSGNPTYQVDVSWDALQIGYIRTTSFSGTVDITSSGALGLDTGSEANSTWYYIWAIAQDDGTDSVMLSTSTTAPTMPGSYTQKRLISAVYNESGGDFRTFYQKNNKYSFNIISLLSGGSATTITPLGIQAVDIIPDNTIIKGVQGRIQSSDGGYVAFYSDSSANNEIYFESAGGGIVVPFTLPILSGNIYYLVETGGTTASANISGFEFNLL